MSAGQARAERLMRQLLERRGGFLELYTRNHVCVWHGPSNAVLQPAVAARTLCARTDIRPGRTNLIESTGRLACLPAVGLGVVILKVRAGAIHFVFRAQIPCGDGAVQTGIAARIFDEVGLAVLEPALAAGPLESRLDPRIRLAVRLAPTRIPAHGRRRRIEVSVVVAR
jgi:hypothetical protein